MDYIINPAWFYLVSVGEGLKVIFVITAIILGIIAVVAICYGCTENDEDCKKLGKKMTILFIISISIGILIPDRETTYQMMIASLATKDNIKDVVQAILDAAKQLTGN